MEISIDDENSFEPLVILEVAIEPPNLKTKEVKDGKENYSANYS